MNPTRTLRTVLPFALAAATVLAQEPPERPLTLRDASEGKAIYIRECSGCHGERGLGDGPASKHIDPLPRDFTARKFKLRTTASGEPPATADVVRVIERGIPGTAMPAFSYLTETERKQVAAHVLRLADMLEEPEPAPVADPGEAPAPTPKLLARGQEIYTQMKCGACHGEKGRGDGPSAETLEDNDGRPIKVRDFTGGQFRGGPAPKDLWYRFITGMDGTPMPSYADSVQGEDRWALVQYVMSLKVTPEKKPYPADPIAAGHVVAEKYSCRGCHILDDGKGGEVGPDLRLSAAKLHPDWVRKFLKAPREVGKLYPWRPYRMPHLGLTDEEVEVMTKYLATVGRRPAKPVLPDVAKFPADKVEMGKNTYVLRCAQCHGLGKVIETPLAAQQGPDFVMLWERLDWDWAGKWMLDPRLIDPTTKMTVPDVTPEQAEAIRMFLYKTSKEELAKR